MYYIVCISWTKQSNYRSDDKYLAPLTFQMWDNFDNNSDGDYFAITHFKWQRSSKLDYHGGICESKLLADSNIRTDSCYFKTVLWHGIFSKMAADRPEKCTRRIACDDPVHFKVLYFNLRNAFNKIYF